MSEEPVRTLLIPRVPFRCPPTNLRSGGNAKATRTAQPFNAPASAVTPRSRDPRAFVTAIESRDGPPLHAGDSAAETLLEAPPPPPLGLEEAAALAEAAAALAKMDKPSRGERAFPFPFPSAPFPAFLSSMYVSPHTR